MNLPSSDADPIGIVSEYREYLKSSGFSTPTVKNYLSDLRHLLVWLAGQFGEFHLVQINEASLRSYRSFLKEKFRSKPSIAARRLSSLRKFLSWAGDKSLVTPQLLKVITPVLEPLEKGSPTLEAVGSISTIPASRIPEQPEYKLPTIPTKIHQKIFQHIKHTRPAWYHHYHKQDWTGTLHTVILILFAIAVGSLFLYSEVIKPQFDKTQEQFSQELGDVLAAATPPRILSFQGRLTNSSDVPISSSTDVVFKIFDARTGGNLLWTSKTWSVTPDSNGIFSVCLGGQDTTDDCLLNGVADTVIPSTLFTDNAALYLGVTTGADSEMTPRQRIASVSYALNSDALEGFHGSQTPGADQVPILDGSGNLAFAGVASITTGSGNLTIDSAGTFTVSDVIDVNGADGSDFAGSVTFNDDIDLTFAAAENLTISNSTLNSASNLVSLAPTLTGDVAAEGLHIDITHSGSGSTAINYGLGVTNVNNAGNANVIDALALFSNDQATETLADGVIIRHNASSGTLTDALQIENTTAGGTITNAINIVKTAGTISTALNIGNDIATGISIGTGVTTAFTASSGDIITSNLGINITDSDTNPGCAAGEYKIYADTSELKLKKCQNGSASDLDTGGAGSGSDSQHSSAYDANENLTNIVSTQVEILQVDITPSTATGDVFIQAQFDVLSGHAVDQSLVVNIEDDATCSGNVVETSTLTITSAGGTYIGTFEIAGLVVDAGASAQSYTLCMSTATGDTDIRFTEMRAWVVDTGADYAEIYTTNDPDLEVGNVVSLDSTLKAGMKKSQKPYDLNLMGVVSTYPGKVVGDVEKEGVKAMPLALIGRVPVKVNGENGPIAPGDLLTSSSTPGVAMKATRAGYVVGRALTSFEGEGTGIVVAFVNTHYANPTQLDSYGDLVNPDLSSTRPVLATSSALLSLDSEDNLVASVSAGTKFVWENTAGQVVAWVSDAGEAFFQKVTALVGDFQKLVFGELAVKKDAQTAGEFTFDPNQTEVFIKSDKVAENSLIYITPTTKTDGLSFYINEKKVGKGFVVGLERSIGNELESTPSASKSLKFNWLIINRE